MTTALTRRPVMLPEEAFRAILRAIYPQRPQLADEVTHPAWFLYTKTNNTPDAEGEAAKKAIKYFRSCVASHQIRLRGVLKTSEPPIDIDPSEAANGHLGIFDATLELRADGRPQRKYTQVYCITDDVEGAVRGLGAPEGDPQIDQAATDKQVRRATKPEIMRAIQDVYDRADRERCRPPNRNEPPSYVLPLLRKKKCRASVAQIKDASDGHRRSGAVGKRDPRPKLST
jgi:hypothetical protein